MGVMHFKPGGSLIPQPIKVIPAYQIKSAKMSGQFDFIVTIRGHLRMARSTLTANDPKVGHIDLSGGQSVRAAGTVTFKDGKIVSFNNNSGHYNRGLSLEEVGVMVRQATQAFADEGLNAIGKFIMYPP
jgi:hypothetical protein